MMITAFEAQAMVRESEAHLKTLVEGLDTPIRQAAKAGRRSIDVDTVYVGHGIETFSHPWWRPLEKALLTLGFRVQTASRKGGGGLGSMDDEPVMYEVVVVSW